VEVEGQRTLQTACSTPVTENVVVNTNTEKVRKARKMIIELLMSNHFGECLTCKRNLNCELQSLAADYGIEELRFEKPKAKRHEIESTTPIVRDNDKCVLCRRCVRVCEQYKALKPLNRYTEARKRYRLYV